MPVTPDNTCLYAGAGAINPEILVATLNFWRQESQINLTFTTSFRLCDSLRNARGRWNMKQWQDHVQIGANLLLQAVITSCLITSAGDRWREQLVNLSNIIHIPRLSFILAKGLSINLPWCEENNGIYIISLGTVHCVKCFKILIIFILSVTEFTSLLSSPCINTK